MGCCYSISLELIKPKKRELSKTLKDIFKDGLEINNGFADYTNFGEDSLHCKSLNDCIGVIFPMNGSTPEVDSHSLVYNTCFDASYSWESVMVEVFKLMCPYIGEGSSLIISTDEGTREVICSNGKCFEQGRLI